MQSASPNFIYWAALSQQPALFRPPTASMPPSSASLQSLLVRHPAVSYTASAAVLGLFALSPTPVLAPLVLIIAILRLSAATFVRRHNGYVKGLSQALLIAISSGVAHIAPSVDALSTPNVAVTVMSAIALLTSAYAILLAFLGARLASLSGGSTWTQLTVFPALWASGWGLMSQVNPVGQLVAWSPVLGLGPYAWIRPILGQWGIDWVTAAWAVVVSEMVGDWVVGSPDRDEEVLVDTEPLLGDVHAPTYGTVSGPAAPKGVHIRSSTRSRSLLLLTGALASLMVPTYMFPVSPLPVNSANTTPLGVACVLPNPRTAGGGTGNPTLGDFVLETQRTQARANIILWPENAVRFESPREREDAFVEIQNKTNDGKYVGVSFEEFVPAEGAGGSGTRRNGFALIGHTGPPVMEYYKRNLVPSTSLPVFACE